MCRLKYYAFLYQYTLKTCTIEYFHIPMESSKRCTINEYMFQHYVYR